MKYRMVALCVFFVLLAASSAARAQEETQLCGGAQATYDRCQDGCDAAYRACGHDNALCGDQWMGCEGDCHDAIPFWCGFWVY